MVYWAYVFILINTYSTPHYALQCELVYLSDPKALQHMLVKDSSITEETTWYTEYVLGHNSNNRC